MMADVIQFSLHLPFLSVASLKDYVESVKDIAVSTNHYIDSFVVMTAFIFTVFTIMVAIYGVVLHDNNIKDLEHVEYKDREFQEYCKRNEVNIAPVLLLPAVYAFTSWVGLTFNNEFGSGFECVEEIFEAISIWYFVRLFEHTMRYNVNRDFHIYLRDFQIQPPGEFKENDPSNFGNDFYGLAI